MILLKTIIQIQKKLKFRKILKKIIYYFSLVLVVTLFWRLLEVLLLGEQTANIVKNIIIALFSYSIYCNLPNVTPDKNN